MKNVIKRMTMAIAGLLFLVQCGTLAAQGPDTEAFRHLIGAPAAGDTVIVGAYCVRVDVPFMKAFTALVVEGGDSAYWQFINQPTVPCYDIRAHPAVKPVKAILVGKIWEFELPSGDRFDMWEANDITGNPAFIWLPIAGQET